jgi:phosphoglycerol transferase MdoB-like AlkP superfamily enzyme
MGEAIIMSDFSNNRLDCLPKLLGQAGYDTYFMHGAYNGSMHFDAFSPIAGFKHFIGLNEFPDHSTENLDPSWGVADEPMLQYAAKVMDEAKKPAFIGLFTLSSHHPYFIPEKLRGKFPKGDNEINESIGYMDYALRKFFETAQTKPWYNNTIFVFTGDHVHPSTRKEYLTEQGVWRVPLMFYIPGLKQRLDVSPERITQHIDILPSVMDLLGITRPDRLLLGQSVFDAGQVGRAYNYFAAGYALVTPENYLYFDREKHWARYGTHSHTWNTVMKDLSAEEASRLPDVKDLKAIAQYFDSGMINNSLFEYNKRPRAKTFHVDH